MKMHIWQVVALLGMLGASVLAAGEKNPTLAQADVPFSFVVGNQTLPAGHYTVTELNEKTIRVANDHQQGAFVLTSKVSGGARENSGKLVFYRYQGTHFLAQVWSAADNTGRQVYESRAQEQLASRAINNEIASMQGTKSSGHARDRRAHE
jgi:hypothetical protein